LLSHGSKRRILLDQGVPKGVRSALSDFDVRSAYQMGWQQLSNGTLIDAAEADGFDLVLTCDQNIRQQQNLEGRRIAIVVLQTNH
jgi:hypothetical protein